MSVPGEPGQTGPVGAVIFCFVPLHSSKRWQTHVWSLLQEQVSMQRWWDVGEEEVWGLVTREFPKADSERRKSMFIYTERAGGGRAQSWKSSLWGSDPCSLSVTEASRASMVYADVNSFHCLCHGQGQLVRLLHVISLITWVLITWVLYPSCYSMHPVCCQPKVLKMYYFKITNSCFCMFFIIKYALLGQVFWFFTMVLW